MILTDVSVKNVLGRFSPENGFRLSAQVSEKLFIFSHLNIEFKYICIIMFTNIYNNDKELVISLRNRERLAFKYLYLHYTRSIKQFVVNNGGQPDDAEEIEQKVIIHLYEKIVSGEFILNENTKLSTYMFAVGKNMWFKKLGRSSHELSEEHINDHIDEFDLNDETDADKIEAEVIKALQNSDTDCKTILTMYYYD